MTLANTLDRVGQYPRLSLKIIPVDSGRQGMAIERFISYSFDSSIIIPADQFMFTFASDMGFSPNESVKTAYDIVKDGDGVELYGNGTLIAKGIVDTVDVQVDADNGERVTITGRDYLGQLEDQTAISIYDKPIWGEFDIRAVLQWLLKNTRIDPNSVILQDAPRGKYLFCAEPGETKLSALQRFLEPLNCLFWMEPQGVLKVGRPNVRAKEGETTGLFKVSRKERTANVLQIRASRASTRIPNVLVPIFSAQKENPEASVDQTLQSFKNTALRPSQLLAGGHKVPRAVAVSIPNGASAQDLSYVNSTQVFTGQKLSVKDQVTPIIASAETRQNKSLFYGYAAREAARANMDELRVQVLGPGHYDENGKPYRTDSVFKVEFDRGNVNEELYVHQVTYQMDPQLGQITRLEMVKKGTIVSHIRAK